MHRYHRVPPPRRLERWIGARIWWMTGKAMWRELRRRARRPETDSESESGASDDDK